MSLSRNRYAAITLPLNRTAKLLLSGSVLRIGAVSYLAPMLGVWILLLVLWLGGSAGRDRTGSVLGPDFTAFYTGGWLVRHGDYSGLYDLQRQASVQQSILPGYEGVSAYLNPPHYAMLLAPLSALPYAWAFAIWTALMLAAFAGTALLLRPLLPALRAPHGWLLIAVALFSPPIYFAVSAGQNTGLTLLLHAAILVALVRRREVLAGALIGLGLLKPQLFVALLPLLLLGGRWPVLLGFGGVSAAVAALLAVTGALETLEPWLALLRSDVYHAEITRQVGKMFSWQSFFTLLLGPGSVATILGWSVALLVFAWLCSLWWREIGDLPLRYGITLLGLMVMGPHLFVYDLGLLALPGLILADRLLRRRVADWIWLRLGLLALYVGSLFAAQAELGAPLVMVPLMTAIAWGAATLAESEASAGQVAGVRLSTGRPTF